ncbi:MAG: dimethylamine corrinoid protein 3, partial [Desulfobacula sp.]|nr:dimethylamine corrinoid protein 3 [Desulfobacula sp.]
MEKAEYMEKATQHIVDADEEAVEKLAREYLEDGFNPLEMIEKGLSEGIRKLGDLFDRGEIFLPHLIIASEA